MSASPRSYRAFFFAASVSLLIVSAVTVASAQRLPSDVIPEHYKLVLTPDLKTATFAGHEEIKVGLPKALDAITLNAIELKFLKVTTEVDGKPLTATVSLDDAKQQATLTFPRALPAGTHTIAIDFTGTLNGQLRGFYLSKTSKRNYAVTQFEATDARRAFPCFDEPAYKATFDISLIIDKGDTGISNTNIVSDAPGPTTGKHTVRFANTPKMSTYLVAFLVGDFQCVSGESDGVPIRACATPDKVQLGKFAVTSAEYILHYFNNYFGIKYPMPKLDMIALPDFEAGAMENFGAITYRETDLLLDESTASVRSKRDVASVVAHEMAHQWFGDMVTMQWWDNIWLNEGFATWMENKPLEKWKPEWNIPQLVASELDVTLNLDAQRTTRTIRAQADTPDEITEMFDGITYGKAGAVLLMVEKYLGEETFRLGVHNYLSAHLYGNATAKDFWNAQAAASHKPVDKIMTSFVIQAGVPILTFASPQAGSVNVSQERFFLSAKVKDDRAQVWTIPACLKNADGPAQCDVLTAADEKIATASGPFLFANAGGTGYYRTSYTPADYEKIVANEKSLIPEERISLLGDQWAKVRAEKITVGSYLDLVAVLKSDESSILLASADSGLAVISTQIATDSERAQLEAWVRQSFNPALDALGNFSPSDGPQKRELRAALFGLLGGIGKDPEVIAQSKRITVAYLAHPEAAEGTLAQAAMRIAATNGDEQLFNQLQSVSVIASNPEIGESALYALGRFTDPALAKRALDYAVSGKVKNQDSIGLIGEVLDNRETHSLAWQYVQQNWDKVNAQITTGSGARLVNAAGNVCTVDEREQFSSFFTSHPVPSSEKALERAKNKIDDCIDLRAAQEPNLKAWLDNHK